MSKNIKVDFTHLPNLANNCYVNYFMDFSRYLVLYGGAGSGKSVFVGQKIVMRMLSETNHKFLVVRKVAETLRESARAEIIGAIEQMGLQSLFRYSTSPTGEMTIKTINGNSIIFRGLDDKEKLKSIKDITGVWIEEASDITLDDFTQLDLRLRGQLKNYKQIILSFNPISAKHWLKKRFFDEKDDEATVSHTTFLDNRFLDDKYISVLNSLKRTNPAYYKIYALGKWGVLKGLIYQDYTIVDELPKDADIHRYGIDFGFNHPTACTEVKIIHKEGIEPDELYLDEIVYESMLTNTQLMRKIKTVAPHLLKLKGYLDSAEPARIADFELAGFDVVGALKDVTAGIDKVQSMKIHVTRRSTHIIDELDLYCWKLDRNGNPLDEVLKENDDACFSGDTKVIVNNKLMNFEDIPREGMITGWDGTQKEYYNGGAIKKDKICLITLSDGSTIKATPDHKFLTINGWVEAQQLKKAQLLKSTTFKKHSFEKAQLLKSTKKDKNYRRKNIYNYISKKIKEFMEVESVEIIKEKAQTYCVTTDDGCFSLANGLIVSNCDSFRYATFIDNEAPKIVDIIKTPRLLTR